jgi:hypothetical protein
MVFSKKLPESFGICVRNRQARSSTLVEKRPLALRPLNRYKPLALPPVVAGLRTSELEQMTQPRTLLQEMY